MIMLITWNERILNMTEQHKRVIVNAILTVVKIEKISHSFVRLHFTCSKPLTIDKSWVCPHIKLLFTDPESGQIPFPQLDENNKIIVNERTRELARTYSVRYFDEATQQLAIDFAIHPEGLATLWAQRATVGDQVGVVGVVSKLNVDDQQLVFMGDIAAVPTISYAIEHLPDYQKVNAFIEVNHPTDVLPLPVRDNQQIHWLVRDKGQPSQLIDSILATDFTDNPPLLFWGGMEASLAQQLRRALKDKYSNLPADAFQITSYWREGLAEGQFKHRE